MTTASDVIIQAASSADLYKALYDNHVSDMNVVVIILLTITSIIIGIQFVQNRILSKRDIKKLQDEIMKELEKSISTYTEEAYNKFKNEASKDISEVKLENYKSLAYITLKNNMHRTSAIFFIRMVRETINIEDGIQQRMCIDAAVDEFKKVTKIRLIEKTMTLDILSKTHDTLYKQRETIESIIKSLPIKKD